MFYPQRVAVGVAIYIIPQSAVLFPESTEESADLSKVEPSLWKNIAASKSMKLTQDTEDDEENYFDSFTHTWVKRANTSITGRKFEFELEKYSMLFEAVYKGVANPLSEETMAKMGAGESLPIFRSNDPYIPVGVKIEQWDKRENKLTTMFFYGDIKADGELSMDGKILRPKLTLEVSASVWNTQENTAAFTGQTETETV